MAVAAEASPYIFVDSIPELATGRRAEQDSAWALLRSRTENTSQACTEDISLVPVEALSTAHSVHEAAALRGEGSPEHLERSEALLLDCKRLVAEWWRKLRPERFDVLRHTYHAPSGDYYSHGQSVGQMTRNALQPMPDNPTEERRRVNERVEDATPALLHDLGTTALRGMRIRTIAECPDEVIAAYEADSRAGKHSGYGGYVPEVAKLMVRDIWLDETSGDRFEEQIALPGEYLEHSVILRALARRGLNTEGMDKTDLQGAQFLASDDLMEFAASLDSVASEEWAVNVFMGEKVAKDFVKDYAAFWQESRIRQEGQRDIAQTVANFVWDLAGDKVDPHAAPKMVEEFVKMLLLDVGKKDFKAAEDMFSTKTAQGLQEVARLEAAGRWEDAFQMMNKVQEEAPGGGYCGAGSCGIQSINEKSAEGQDIKEKLDAKSGDKVVKDNERACQRCNRKGAVYYAYNPTKVNKLCTSCGATDSKQTSFRVG